MLLSIYNITTLKLLPSLIIYNIPINTTLTCNENSDFHNQNLYVFHYEGLNKKGIVSDIIACVFDIII